MLWKRKFKNCLHFKYVHYICLFTDSEHQIFMNENQIIQTALGRFTEQTGFRVDWKPAKGEMDGEADFYINNEKVRVFGEVKKEFRVHHLENVIELARTHRPFIVVAETIFPAIKEILRENNIGYIDTAGNVYLKTGGKLLWIDGNKPREQKIITNRAFTKTGLKMVFYLLLDLEAINLPYRKLADATGVALGNIKNIIEGLKEAGFIIKINKTTLKIQNKEALLDRWLTGFRETLKPALHLGTYRFYDKNRLRNWEDLPLPVPATQWGGEPAGQAMTNYLVPMHFTVYTHQERELIIKWKLIPDPAGNVKVYEKFWNDERFDGKRFAPPLIVYADLMETDDPRCQETAKMIYDKYLKNEFK